MALHQKVKDRKPLQTCHHEEKAEKRKGRKRRLKKKKEDRFKNTLTEKRPVGRPRRH